MYTLVTHDVRHQPHWDFHISKDNWQLRFFRTSPLLFFVFHFPSPKNICLFRGPGTSLAKLQKFTNLDVPGIRGFPLLSAIFEAQVVWGRYNLIKTPKNSRKHTASIAKSQLLRHINSRNIEAVPCLSFSCSPKGLFAEGTDAPGSTDAAEAHTKHTFCLDFCIKEQVGESSGNN